VNTKPLTIHIYATADDAVLLVYDAVSVGNRTPIFRGHYDVKTLRNRARTCPFNLLILLFSNRLTRGWRIRDRILVGTRFSAHQDRVWGPPSLLYNGYQVFPGVKCGRGVPLTTHPLLVSRSWNSRAIPLPILWATPGL